jgi:hypothetical protein
MAATSVSFALWLVSRQPFLFALPGWSYLLAQEQIVSGEGYPAPPQTGAEAHTVTNGAQVPDELGKRRE